MRLDWSDRRDEDQADGIAERKELDRLQREEWAADHLAQERADSEVTS